MLLLQARICSRPLLAELADDPAGVRVFTSSRIPSCVVPKSRGRCRAKAAPPLRGSFRGTPRARNGAPSGVPWPSFLTSDFYQDRQNHVPDPPELRWTSKASSNSDCSGSMISKPPSVRRTAITSGSPPLACAPSAGSRRGTTASRIPFGSAGRSPGSSRAKRGSPLERSRFHRGPPGTRWAPPG